MKHCTRRRGSSSAAVVGLLFIFMAVVILGFQWYATDFNLKQGLTTPLQRVAMSSNVTTAHENLTEAIAYLENNHLTTGNSSYFFNDRLNDLGYFHENLQKAKQELEVAIADKNPTQLSESNLLIRVKEVIVSHKGGKDSGDVFVPDHLEYFPHLYANLFLFIGMLLIGFIGCVCLKVATD